MKERVITGVILVGLLLVVGLINNPYLVKFVIVLIAIASMYEARKLFGIEKDVFYFLGVLSFFSIFINPLFIGIVGVLSIAGFIAFYQKDITLISLAFYPFLPLMILSELYVKTGVGVIGWLILIIALTDSFAYFIGKNFAKKFIPQGFSITSPNKSWEGVIGGVVIATIFGSIVGLVFFNFLNSFLIVFGVSISSVFGDLFESFLKRRAGVKDSGNILPGHGGVLDRIDGYLFAAPLMWAIIQAIG
ncbi:phosphatidate cytidylyltransferase [Caminibacter profundus]